MKKGNNLPLGFLFSVTVAKKHLLRNKKRNQEQSTKERKPFLKVNVSHITQRHFPQVFSPIASTFLLAMTDEHFCGLGNLKLKYQEGSYVCHGDWLLWDRADLPQITQTLDIIKGLVVFVSGGILQGRQGSRLQWQTNADETTCRWLLCGECWVQRTTSTGSVILKHGHRVLWLRVLSAGSIVWGSSIWGN